MKKITGLLSNKERNYLTNAEQLPKSYGYILEHRIKKKLRQFYRLELPLIEQSTNLTEFHKNLTENNKIEERARRDSNPRPNAPQAFALSKLCNEPIDSLVRIFKNVCKNDKTKDYASTSAFFTKT